MPITEDSWVHEIIGTAFKKGCRAGRNQGREEGRQEGELKILRRQIERRFVAVPDRVDRRWAECAAVNWKNSAFALLDATTPEDRLAPEQRALTSRVSRDSVSAGPTPFGMSIPARPRTPGTQPDQ